jgi:hypothetical protein
VSKNCRLETRFTSSTSPLPTSFFIIITTTTHFIVNYLPIPPALCEAATTAVRKGVVVSLQSSLFVVPRVAANLKPVQSFFTQLPAVITSTFSTQPSLINSPFGKLYTSLHLIHHHQSKVFSGLSLVLILKA